MGLLNPKPYPRKMENHMEKKLENEMHTVAIMNYIRVYVGAFWDNGKEHGNYTVA